MNRPSGEKETLRSGCPVWAARVERNLRNDPSETEMSARAEELVGVDFELRTTKSCLLSGDHAAKAGTKSASGTGILRNPKPSEPVIASPSFHMLQPECARSD